MGLLDNLLRYSHSTSVRQAHVATAKRGFHWLHLTSLSFCLWYRFLLGSVSPSFGICAPDCCDTISTHLCTFTCAAAVVRLLLPGRCAPLSCPAVCVFVPGLCAPLSCPAISVPAPRGSSFLANARVRSDAAILLAEARALRGSGHNIGRVSPWKGDRLPARFRFETLALQFSCRQAHLLYRR